MSLPLVLIGAWFMGLRHASYRVFMAITLLLAAMGGALFWMSAERAFIGPYNPAHLQDGKIIPGQNH
jgi:hypothetical protein